MTNTTVIPAGTATPVSVPLSCNAPGASSATQGGETPWYPASGNSTATVNSRKGMNPVSPSSSLGQASPASLPSGSAPSAEDSGQASGAPSSADSGASQSSSNFSPSTSGANTSPRPNSQSLSTSASTAQHLITIEGQTITANRTGFIISPASSGGSSVTLSLGQPPVTLGSQTISLGTSGTLVVGTSTTVLDQPANTASATAPDTLSSASPPQGTTLNAQSLIKFGSQTLPAYPTGFKIPPTSSGTPVVTVRPGGPPVTIGSQTVSLSTSGTLVVGTSTAILVAPPYSASTSASSQIALPSGASAVTSVIGGSTVEETFLPTTYRSLISLADRFTSSITLGSGSTGTVVPIIIWPGGIGWQYPSLTSNNPILIALTGSPSVEPIVPSNSGSTSSSVPSLSAQPGQGSSTTGPSATGSLVFVSQSPDPKWSTEAPLRTQSSTTTSIFFSSVSELHSDGHTDRNGHPLPVFWHPHCLVSCPNSHPSKIR